MYKLNCKLCYKTKLKHFCAKYTLKKNLTSIIYKSNTINKPSGKKILNTTFYPDQKGINKFIKGKSELKGNKQVF